MMTVTQTAATRCTAETEPNLRDIGRILDQISGANDIDRCQRNTTHPSGLCWQHLKLKAESDQRYERFLCRTSERD